MNPTDARFAGSIPALYEQYLAPLVFQPYADDLAARLRDEATGPVLETAAGTGVVTRALRRALSPTVRIVATDLNEGMLRVAANLNRDPSTSFTQADAQKLPFDDAMFGVAVCQFGVMFFPDKALAFREVKRVLRPKSRFVFNVWGPLAKNEASRVVGDTVAAAFPEDPPRFIERTPFGFWDGDVIRRTLDEAGFAGVEIEPVEKTTYARTADDLAIGLCQGTPMRGEIESRDGSRLEEITAKASAALRARFGERAVENRMLAYVVVATSP